MPDFQQLTSQELFRQWRGGNASAGQAMAQRFTDWYYAVTTSRLGDAAGRKPLQHACVRFQKGIMSVGSPGELVDWAYGLLVEELKGSGYRSAEGGDYGNKLTRDRPASQLLLAARAALPAEQMKILAMAYDTRHGLEEVVEEAERQGGMPFAILSARYALKRWLHDNEQVPFSELPDSPNLDLAPLPLYEAGRLSGSEAEEVGFEKWLLTDIGLCRDVAEFAVFALSLRSGALRAEGVRTTAPVPAPSPNLSPGLSPGMPAGPILKPIASSEDLGVGARQYDAPPGPSPDPTASNPQSYRSVSSPPSNPQASNPQGLPPQVSNPQSSNPQSSNPQGLPPQASNPQSSNPQSSRSTTSPQPPVTTPRAEPTTGTKGAGMAFPIAVVAGIGVLVLIFVVVVLLAFFLR